MKQKFLSKLILTAVLSIMSIGMVNAQGIPVYDNVQGTVNHIENMGKMLEQIQKAQEQIDSMRQQYESITGSRGFGTADQIGAAIPDRVFDELKAMQTGGLENASQQAKDLYEQLKISDTCKNMVGMNKSLCEQQTIQSYQDYVTLQSAQNSATRRVQQINGLVAQINATQDPKAIAELQARLQGETATLQNETMKIQIYQQQMNAQADIQAQRVNQNSAERARRPVID